MLILISPQKFGQKSAHSILQNTVMQTIDVPFLSSYMEKLKKRDEMNFNNLFYLNQYIKNTLHFNM